MTEIDNNIGYSGYVAKQPEPDLLKCNEQDTDNKQKFTTFSKGSIHDDLLTIDLDVMQSQGPGLYHLDNQYGCSCGLQEARSIQVSQPGIHLTGGFGWIAENGCLVDNDSKLRQEPQKLTNKREINQITERLFATTPNLKTGHHDVDVESVIRPGVFTTDQRPCGPLSGVTIGNYFTPMIAKLKSEVQDPKHIIPEDSMGSWVRGGLPSREMVRNKDYLRRYQQKTFSPN
jgi:hypothetical protein